MRVCWVGGEGGEYGGTTRIGGDTSEVLGEEGSRALCVCGGGGARARVRICVRAWDEVAGAVRKGGREDRKGARGRCREEREGEAGGGAGRAGGS